MAATDGDPASAVAHIEARAAEVRERQVARALRRLEADGDLTERQRAAVEALGERLVDRLLAGPRAGLREPTRRDDDTAATAIALFSPETGR